MFKLLLKKKNRKITMLGSIVLLLIPAPFAQQANNKVLIFIAVQFSCKNWGQMLVRCVMNVQSCAAYLQLHQVL